MRVKKLVSELEWDILNKFFPNEEEKLQENYNILQVIEAEYEEELTELFIMTENLKLYETKIMKYLEEKLNEYIKVDKNDTKKVKLDLKEFMKRPINIKHEK